MSLQKRTSSLSMKDLSKIYEFNEDINEYRARILILSYNKRRENLRSDRIRNIHIENLQMQINKLTLMRRDELMRIYSNVNIIRRGPLSSYTKSRSELITSPLKIIETGMTSSSTELNMDDDDDDIIYPEGVIDLHPYKIVARYRRSINESTNFREYPLIVSIDSIETLILGLESFVEEHGCDLIFTDKDEDERFDKSIYRATYDIIDLGSIHLLATDSLLTANFQFEIDFNYDKKIIKSKENIEQFVDKFCKAICKILSCDLNDVRVFSISKFNDKTKISQLNFGLITFSSSKTEQLARQLQENTRLGFPNDNILRYVKPKQYEYKWKPSVTHLKIRPDDLDPQYNFDYKQSDLPEKLFRGNFPYYLPIGWYRHAIKVQNKYKGSQNWLGSLNAEDEWPVAYHGTHIDALNRSIDRSRFYNVATHCNEGTHPQYTIPFTVTSFPGKTQQFSIVFQCRVEPHKFTIHKSPVVKGETWRFVDFNAIRPYGILLKKENSTEHNK